jgi:hypothetical protein
MESAAAVATVLACFSFPARRRGPCLAETPAAQLARVGIQARRRDLPGGPISQSRPGYGKGEAGMNHHRDCGSDNNFDDPAGWRKASYSAHPIDSMEPLSDEPNPYRQAAIYHLKLMYAVDEFITAAEDSRLAVVVVAIVLGWPSTRGFTLSDIAGQLGCTTAMLTRSIALFKTIAGLGVSAGDGVRFIRPGAGLNGDKPAASIQA